jgi:DNA-packaging protein gp3
MAGGRPPFYETVDDLENAIEGYFLTLEKVDKDGNPLPSKPPTVAGLAYALGYADRSSLYSQTGRGEEFSYILKKTILYIESFHETALYEASHPTGSIFWLKNHGWMDKQPEGHGDTASLRILVENVTDNSNVEINIPTKEKTPD